MSLAAKPIVNPASLFTISKASHSHLCLSIPLKPFKLQLSCSYSASLSRSYSASLSLPSFLSSKKEPISRVSVIAGYQEENNPVDLEEGNLNWDAPESDVVEPNEEAKLYVGNLPYDVDDTKLAGLFQGAGVVEIAEIIRHRDTEDSRGFAFVTMRTVEEAEKAVELFHRYDIGGRLLIVNKAAPKGSRPERTPREFRAGSRIYVGNLPWSADDSRLEQIFKEYGNVVSARVVIDRETGRSRGFGFVEMSIDSEMNKAIANLDGLNLDGRQIRVNVAADRRQSGF